MKKTLRDFCIVTSILLFFAYGMSLFAAYGWIFDIFSHFAIQYAIGSLVLCAVLLFYRRFVFCCLLFAVACINTYEIRYSYSDPWVLSPIHQEEPNLTIVHFNKLYRNNNWDELDQWISAHHEEIDVFIFQEKTAETTDKIREYSQYFPHRYPDKKWNHYNDIAVMSRHPFKAEKISDPKSVSWIAGTKVVIEKPGLSEPVHIYSIHAFVPWGAKRWVYQSVGLNIMSDAIVNDTHPYKIFSGDWNLTPYSPKFPALLEKTGMKYNDYSLFPKVTWRSGHLLPFLKIPIDHMIYSPEIKMIEKTVGGAFGSDHHMVIAKFYIPES